MTVPRLRSRSNRRKKITTPGHNNVIHYRRHRLSPLRCGISGKRLNGIPNLRTGQIGRLSKTKKTVNRPYGGKYSAKVTQLAVQMAVWSSK